MSLRIFNDAFRMGVPETVDRLIFVTNDRNCTRARNRVDEFLIGAIEILVFIDEDVVKAGNVWMGRILRNKIEGKWNDFAN